MTKQEIRDGLLVSLREVQEASGREVPPMTDDLCPLLDLPGFESLNGEEVASELEEWLRCRIDHHARLFCGQKRPLTIAEIVDRVYEIASPEAGG